MTIKYTVTWSIEVEVDGDHKAAAQAVASRYFQEHIAAGQYDSACSFVVAGPVGIPVGQIGHMATSSSRSLRDLSSGLASAWFERRREDHFSGSSRVSMAAVFSSVAVSIRCAQLI